GKDTEVPALRGLTPPTMFVPEASMRVVCFCPSEPVMPWTMTLEASVMKMAMFRCFSFLVRAGSGVGQLGGLVGRAVHGVRESDERVGGLREDAAALLDVVAVETHDERLRGRVTEDLEGLDDAR